MEIAAITRQRVRRMPGLRALGPVGKLQDKEYRATGCRSFIHFLLSAERRTLTAFGAKPVRDPDFQR
ncbi:MAG: hypothetical protein LBI59_07200, partial [Candidatus Accumulibacter sp.]|nr:hypothetical protein [Accumulibacter sp.]